MCRNPSLNSSSSCTCYILINNPSFLSFILSLSLSLSLSFPPLSFIFFLLRYQQQQQPIFLFHSDSPPPIPMDACKRSGQIPAFGNWDYANDLPITQYFESARQAGLIRFSSASGECDPSFASAPHLNRPPPPHHFQENGRGRRCSCAKEPKKQGRVCDVAAPPRKQASAKQRSKQQPPPPPPTKAARPPKAVDEDLYKIPPDLLNSSKRKKMWGIFSRCLVPSCKV